MFCYGKLIGRLAFEYYDRLSNGLGMFYHTGLLTWLEPISDNFCEFTVLPHILNLQSGHVSSRVVKKKPRDTSYRFVANCLPYTISTQLDDLYIFYRK